MAIDRKLDKRMRVTGLLLAFGLLGAACGGQQPQAPAVQAQQAPPAPMAARAQEKAESGAADLRVGLNNLLGEHVALASTATGAALRGDNAGFMAFANALNGPGDSNSTDLVNAIGAAYGEDAKKAFDPLWRKHIGFFVNYTQGLATGDTAKQSKAVEDLKAYTQEFGAFIESATGLPKQAVADLVLHHVVSLKEVVDAQAAGDPVKENAALRSAYHHMGMIADPLAKAIAQKTGKFPGNPDSSAASLRTVLNVALREHLFLASNAASAALRGDTAGFQAAATALNGTGPSNSTDIITAVGSAYGEDAKKAFDPLWRKHIGFVVSYTQGVAAGDTAKQSKAVEDLKAYSQEFGAFIESANGLPKHTVADLVLTHVLTLKDVIDAAAKNDAAKLASSERTAAHHMGMIADPLAEATAKKFPEKFSS